VVSATVTGAGLREIYFPAHERGMAHYSIPSPDRLWALVVEMNGNGDWRRAGWLGWMARARQGRLDRRVRAPLRVVAGWGWMYFTAAVEGRSHIWRQRFPEGEPEQITFGPTEEDGVAVQAKDGALITSVGVHESAIWIHDGAGSGHFLRRVKWLAICLLL